MYAWLIAHNLGLVLIAIPCAGIAWFITKIEDAVKKNA